MAPRVIGKLSALKVERAKTTGMLSDGGGLYLQVTSPTARSWLFRYARKGKERQLGLGSLNALALADARVKAGECRNLLAKGVDPLENQRQRDAQAAQAIERGRTFKACALDYIKAHKPSWKSAKHGQQWENSLSTYAYPVFGEMAVADVDTALVLKALEPVWTAKPETATRLRGRIEAILDWAKVRQYRAGDNPARWNGHLKALLPSPGKLREIQHHPALPHDQLGGFMADLRALGTVAALALEYVILTTARTTEAREATWTEIDFDKGVWVIPARRMKAGREHTIPLPSQAVAVLRRIKKLDLAGDYIFPSGNPGKPLAAHGMLDVLEDMGRTEITVHGFRSTFRDWAAERTSFPRQVAEAALAHSLPDKVEASYLRTEFLGKRSKLMQTWANYCDVPSVKRGDNVVGIAS